MASSPRLGIQLPRLEPDATSVLVVDDEPDVRNLVAFKLTAAGYEALTASDGGSALAMIERRAPDLVILDVSMPGMSGTDVCRRLRAAVRTQAMPIIMLTARSTAMHENEGLMAGADVYLTKPFSPRTLLATVDDLLSYSR